MNRSRAAKSIRAGATLIAGLLLLGACGVPIDDDPIPVALPAEFDLNPTTTTSTTVPDAEGARFHRVFFILDGRVTPRTRELADNITVQQLIDTLLAGPDEDERALSIESRLGPDLVAETRELISDRSVLVLNFIDDLDPEASSFLGVEGELRVEAIAQLVFTGMDFEGVSGVLFQRNEVFQPVANGEGEVQQLDADGVPVPLTNADFLNLAP